MTKKCVCLLLVAMMWASACRSEGEELPEGLYAVIDTSKGSITCRLEFEKVPMTEANFAGLAEGKIESRRGKEARFYDGLKWHRVITKPPFMIQGGCPNGDGSGDPGYKFPDEFHPKLKHSKAGILSMANPGPDSNGSQFFITLAPTPWLDGKHSVFGEVVSGMDKVVRMIRQGDDIKSIKIKRVGEAAKAFKNDAAAFKKLVAAGLVQKQKRDKLAAGQIDRIIETKWPGTKRSKTGLRYLVKKKGSGRTPKRGEAVTVHYVGSLLNGKMFDNSRTRGQPFVFAVGAGRVIKGWDEALLEMRKGELRTIVVPPSLGYGGMDMRDQRGNVVIPANSWLVFDIEMLEVGMPPRRR